MNEPLCDRHPNYKACFPPRVKCDGCLLAWLEHMLDDIEELYVAVLLEYDTLVNRLTDEGKLE